MLRKATSALVHGTFTPSFRMEAELIKLKFYLTHKETRYAALENSVSLKNRSLVRK